jgi:drug/metabolite transporter (DMT)-like permease
MSQVGQVQLVQPVLSIGWAVLFLGERLTWATVLGGVIVILLAGTAVRIRLGTPPAGPPRPNRLPRGAVPAPPQSANR